MSIKKILKRKEVKKRIKEIENYLGPKVDYSSDHWPTNKLDKWLMEYLYIIKSDYLMNSKKKKCTHKKN